MNDAHQMIDATEEVDLSYASINEAIKTLQDFQSEIGTEDNEIDLCDYGVITIKFKRLEKDYERNNRITWAKQKEDREKAAYLSLKAKYENTENDT